MKLVCMYCGKVISDGDEPASHGVCEDCMPWLRKDMGMEDEDESTD